MNDRQHASVLWGVIGGLSFGVLAQGYQLLTDATVDFAVVLAVAVVVGAVAGGLSYALDARLARNGRT